MNQQPSDALPSILPVPGTDPVKNASFTMELYDTLPFNNPSRQAFYTISQNQQVFAEVCCYISDSTVLLYLNHIYLPWLEEVFPQVVFHFGLKRILF